MSDFPETGRITSKGQITVPCAVRRALGLSAGDRVAYRVVDGVVTLTKAEPDEDDPAIASFLDLLTRDIAAGQHLRVPDEALEATLREYAGLDVDPEATIEGETAL